MDLASVLLLPLTLIYSLATPSVTLAPFTTATLQNTSNNNTVTATATLTSGPSVTSISYWL